MADASWLTSFPQLSRMDLLAIRKTLDGAYKAFSREYGDTIESIFHPVLAFLVWFEKLLINTPWPIIILVIGAIVYFASRSWKLLVGVVISLLLVGFFGMWEDTMSTLSMITVCTLISILLGIPVGIAMARSDRVQKIMMPILDVMQTMPAFVYLIPVVMLLGIGKIPGLISVVIYAIPPVIRLTNLGIRLVDKEVLEAATAFGANGWQRLFNVQIPLAMPKHHGRHQPDHHDGPGNGRCRLDDWCEGTWSAGTEIHSEPVFHAWPVQWSGYCCARHHL